MPTSFPGMDPYLETYWGSLHVELIVYARDQLHEQLPSDSATRIHERLHPTISGRIVRQLRVEECSREQPVVTVIEFPIAVHRAWKERRSEVYTGCFVRRENDNSR